MSSRVSVISKTDLFCQKSGNLVSNMDGEKVMLNMEKGKYYNLGTTGGDIWDLLQEPISIQEIVTSLCAVYDVEEADCEEQVMQFLENLLKEGLIEVSS